MPPTVVRRVSRIWTRCPDPGRRCSTRSWGQAVLRAARSLRLVWGTHFRRSPCSRICSRSSGWRGRPDCLRHPRMPAASTPTSPTTTGPTPGACRVSPRMAASAPTTSTGTPCTSTAVNGCASGCCTTAATRRPRPRSIRRDNGAPSGIPTARRARSARRSRLASRVGTASGSPGRRRRSSTTYCWSGRPRSRSAPACRTSPDPGTRP